jgi:hypothetical protein
MTSRRTKVAWGDRNPGRISGSFHRSAPSVSGQTQRYPSAPSLVTLTAVLITAVVLNSGLWAWSQKNNGASTATVEYQLVDITASTRIQFTHVFSPDMRYIMESMSGGVALIDYDRDGWPDIYFTNAPTVEMALKGEKARSALYRNNHDGTFTDVTDKAGVGYPCWANGAVVGDYDNDGWPDLLVTCYAGVVLYRNNRDGTFTDATKEAGLGGDHLYATGAAFGDYDNDGFADLFIAHYVDVDLQHLPAFGSGKTCKYLGIDVQCGPRGLKGSPDNLFHNNRNGTFTDVSKLAGVNDPENRFGLTAVWSDFANDGNLDLFVANDGQPNYLYKGDGKGTFQDIALASGVAENEDGVEQANMGVALGDYLHTGRINISITHFDNEYTVFYRNDGAMNFTDISVAAGMMKDTPGYVGWGDAFADFANSGWDDFLQVDGHVYPQMANPQINARYMQPKLLFRNQRDGTFRSVAAQSGAALQIPQVSRGMAIGDLFNDGRLEAVIENLAGKPMILRPDGASDNHWVSFQLEGTKANRLALNARVRITAGDLTQLDEIRSGGSYLSQHDLRLHFGLGTHGHIDKAEIIWPNGTTENLANLAVDRFYVIREGAGVVSSKTPSDLHSGTPAKPLP